MAITFDCIASNTLSANASDVTFSSIPSTYTDLRMIVQGNCTATITNNLSFQINGLTTTTYSQVSMAATNVTVTGSRSTAQTQFFGSSDFGGTPNTTTFTIDFLNYADTSRQRTCLWSMAGSGQVQRAAGLNSTTNALSSIRFFAQGATLAAGSTFAIYGITKH